jgi:dual specificity phosphatase 12
MLFSDRYWNWIGTNPLPPTLPSIDTSTLFVESCDSNKIDNMASAPPKCRVAVVGLNHQRVARVISLLNEPSSKVISTIHQYQQLSESDLPKEIPLHVEIEYLPCVATFDSYPDEMGNNVRYLAKLEYHGELGTLMKGQSLAPFFDADISSNAIENPFPGFAAVAVGCGIDSDEDVEKIASFINTLSTSCTTSTSDGSENDSSNELLVECIKCNPEYSSMKEENDAYRNLSEDEKKEAIANQTIGPGKMTKFVAEVAQKVVSQRWVKELQELENEKNKPDDEDSTTETTEQLDKQLLADEPPPSTPHIPDPEKIRYACKRCRTVLFGELDLEDPPHAQSLHHFRKKSATKVSQSKMCANHFLANPLSWMTSMDDMEGKLHCFKCETKIGHYSWTGAQCSCGTWVTPAIMIPMSKVDEMPPNGSIFVDPNNTTGVVRMPVVFAVDKGGMAGDDTPPLSTAD